MIKNLYSGQDNIKDHFYSIILFSITNFPFTFQSCDNQLIFDPKMCTFWLVIFSLKIKHEYIIASGLSEKPKEVEAAIKAENLNFIEFFVVQYCKPKKKFLPKMKSRKYQNGYPLLHLACEMGEIQIVQYLVECVGFRVNQKD